MVETNFGAAALDEGDPPDNPTPHVIPSLILKDTTVIETEVNGRILMKLRTTIKQQAKQVLNPLSSHKQLLAQLRIADPTLQVYTNNTDNPLDLENDYPKDEATFKAAFTILDESSARSDFKVISISHLISMNHRLNDLKRKTPTLMEYLNEKKLSIKIDKYQGQKVVSTGIILRLHPRLYNRDHVQKTIKSTIANIKLQDTDTKNLTEELLHRYFQVTPTTEDNMIEEVETPATEDGFELAVTKKKQKRTVEKDNFDYVVDYTKPINVPRFELAVRPAYAGNGKTKVTSEIIEIQCGLEDAQFLNLLLSIAGSKELLPHNCQYLPRGTLNSESEKNKYRNALVAQNSYISTTTAVFVRGLSADIFRIPVENNKTTEPLYTALMKSKLISEITETSSTTTEGRYAFITTVPKINLLRHMIDTHLTPLFENGGIPNDLQFQDITPGRTDSVRFDSQTLSYAKTVLSQFSDDTTTTATTLKRNFSSRRQKKPVNQIVYSLDNATFPKLPTAPNSPAKKKVKSLTETNTELNSTSDQSLTSQTTSTTPFNLDQIENAIMKTLEPVIQAQIKAVSKSSTDDILALVNQQANDLSQVKASVSAIQTQLTKQAEQFNRIFLAMSVKMGIDIDPLDTATEQDDQKASAVTFSGANK
jgi:hypothetical protein